VRRGDDDAARVCALYQEGLSFARICAAIGCGRYFVAGALKLAGIAPRQAGGQMKHGRRVTRGAARQERRHCYELVLSPTRSIWIGWPEVKG